MITVTRISDTQSSVDLGLSRGTVNLLNSIDTAVRSLSGDFDPKDLISKVRLELKGKHGVKFSPHLKGTVIEGWAVKANNSSRSMVLYAVLLPGGQVAVVRQEELEKDVVH